ncbi:MAG TPA: hypothetical protein VK703_07760 [Candidatus Acidoferrales bacterium]|jgi:hypothetical protein|nr:hypothetical protein [Candidatus Acidoferrales bacterium]
MVPKLLNIENCSKKPTWSHVAFATVFAATGGENEMLRSVPAFTIVALTAVLLALFEPALALSDADRLVSFVFLPVSVGSPFWLASFFSYGRAARA